MHRTALMETSAESYAILNAQTALAAARKRI
jgi:hypothetical protein